MKGNKVHYVKVEKNMKSNNMNIKAVTYCRFSRKEDLERKSIKRK